MAQPALSIAVVAPANRLEPAAAERVEALARAAHGDRVRLHFHPQCFLSAGHFAGADAARSQAFLDVANDPAFDAVWFARGGYGACRLEDGLFGRLNRAAHLKTYLGYSDIGVLLARLAREGVGRSVHGPMPADINRQGGEVAILRALSWFLDRDAAAVEPSWRREEPAFAFNLTVLSHFLGTRAEPNFAGAVIMIEDVDEHLYRIDRALFHVTSSDNVRRCAGIRLGRFSKIPENDPPFDKSVEEVAADWSRRSGIAILGAADIGHDAANRIVPFPAVNAKSA